MLRLLPDKRLEHGNQVTHIIRSEHPINTFMGNAVERRLVEFVHDDTAVLGYVVLQQIHEAYLLGGQVRVPVQELLEVLFDGFGVKADDFPHGEMQLVGGTPIKLVEPLQAHARLTGRDGRGQRTPRGRGNRRALTDLTQRWIGGQHAVEDAFEAATVDHRLIGAGDLYLPLPHFDVVITGTRAADAIARARATLAKLHDAAQFLAGMLQPVDARLLPELGA